MHQYMELSMRKYKLYCGPTLVKPLAERLRTYRWDSVFEGTENVYFESPSTYSPEGVWLTLKSQGVVSEHGYNRNDLTVNRNGSWVRE